MSKNLEMTVTDVVKFGRSATLFPKNALSSKYENSEVWIKGNVVMHKQWLYINGKKTPVYHNVPQSNLDEIYSRIKVLYDRSGIRIATRLNTNCRLLTTGKGESKNVRKLTLTQVYNQSKAIGLIEK